MTGRVEYLGDVIEKALKVGLASAPPPAPGLILDAPAFCAGDPPADADPVARVAVVTVGLAIERDWTFTIVSFVVLAILASGIWVAVHR